MAHLHQVDMRPIARRWRDLHSRLASAASARDLAADRDELAEGVDFLDANIERAQRQREQAAGGLGRLCKSRRQQLAGLERRLDHLHSCRASQTAQLDAVDQQLARLPSPGEAPRLRDELDQLRAQLWDAIQTRLPAIEAHPPAYLVSTLGTRPTDPTDRAVWREAVTRIEA